MRVIDSPVFGSCLLLDEADIKAKDYINLEHLVKTYPSNAFALLNKKANNQGFCFTIDVLEESEPNNETPWS